MRSLATRKYLSLLVISFLAGVVAAPLQSLFPVYVEATLSRAPIFTAQLRIAFLVLGGIAAVAGGALCDTLGSRRTYILGITGVVGSGMVFLTGQPVLLALLLGYCGLMFGFSTTAGQTYLMDAAPASSLGVATAGYFLGQTLGNSVGSAAGGWVAQNFSFHRMGEFMATAAVALLIASVFMPESRIVRHETRSLSATFLHYGDLLQRREVRLLVVLRFLPTFFWGCATLVIPLLIYRATHNKAAAGYYAAVSLTVAASFQILTGRMCDRLGRRLPVLVAVSLETLFAACLALASHSYVGVFVFGVAVSAAAWSLSTTMPGLVTDVAAPEEKGRVLAVTHVAWCMAMLSGNLLGGALIDVAPWLPFTITAAGCGIAILCARHLLAWIRENRAAVAVS